MSSFDDRPLSASDRGRLFGALNRLIREVGSAPELQKQFGISTRLVRVPADDRYGPRTLQHLVRRGPLLFIQLFDWEAGHGSSKYSKNLRIWAFCVVKSEPFVVPEVVFTPNPFRPEDVGYPYHPSVTPDFLLSGRGSWWAAIRQFLPELEAEGEELSRPRIIEEERQRLEVHAAERAATAKQQAARQAAITSADHAIRSWGGFGGDVPKPRRGLGCIAAGILLGGGTAVLEWVARRI